MATEAKKADNNVGGDAPKKKSKLPLIIGLVVVLAAGGGGAYFFMSKKSAEDPAKAGEHAEGHAVMKPPVFLPLDSLTVNLASEGNEQYLQVTANLKVLDANTSDKVKLYIPEIRHRVLLLLASKKASEIGPTEGRERLSEELRTITNNVMLVAAGKPPRAFKSLVKKQQDKGEEKKKEVVEEKTEEQAEEEPIEEAVETEKPAENSGAVKRDDPIQGVFFTSFIIQ